VSSIFEVLDAELEADAIVDGLKVSDWSDALAVWAAVEVAVDGRPPLVAERVVERVRSIREME
jgi:hypothetical protein